MIEILCGMIASGKSTYSKNKANDGWVIINDDAIVNAVHADQYTLYQESLKPLYKGIEVFILNTAIAMGKNVVVDKGLNLSRQARQRWVSLGRSLDIPVKCVVFEVFSPEVHAQRRCESENRGHPYEYWLRVAKHHFSVYNEPDPSEGFDSIEIRKWS